MQCSVVCVSEAEDVQEAEDVEYLLSIPTIPINVSHTPKNTMTL